MNLVVDKMRELEHVDVTNGYGLLELFAGHAVDQRTLAGAGQASSGEERLDFRFLRAIEYGGAEPDAAAHTGRDAQGLLVVECKKLVESGGVP